MTGRPVRAIAPASTRWVHLNSPIPDHAWMTIAALEAGKHVACTVPMATSVEDCERIVAAVDRIHDSDLVAHVHRSLFDVARQYRESIDVYGSRRSFEWTLVEGGRHVLHTAERAEAEIPEKIEVPDFAERLPEPIRRFTTRASPTTVRRTSASRRAPATAAHT